MIYTIYLGASTVLLLIYFKLASHFQIIDKPNHRSSHVVHTIRGAGVIFPIVLLIHCVTSDFSLIFFAGGLALISLISFYDDLKPLPNIIRLICHLIAVTLMLLQADFFGFSVWIVGLVYILIIGTINAYNFMDGINGITGAYTLLALSTLLFVNQTIAEFVPEEWMMILASAVLAFCFFNFRSTAKCFAGDVGSVSLAFSVTFFIMMLIIVTGDFKYINFLLVYGLDAVTTIVFRLIRRENIFLAHRTHFYQYLANNLAFKHTVVATLYTGIQLIINIITLTMPFSVPLLIIFILGSGVIFVVIRIFTEGSDQLFKKRSHESEIRT